jgi:gamma-glutamyltranspeptidase/glutathione hydrolase
LLSLAALDGDRYPTPAASAGGGVLQPESMDRMMRIFLEANSAAREVLGDRDDSLAAWRRLMDSRNLVEMRKAAQSPAPAARSAMIDPAFEESMAAETTHFVIVDAAGNVVSATQSQSNHFGAGLVPPGTGVVLNNSLSNFNRIAGNPNQVAPGRRPRTTIAPAIIARGGKLVAALGLPGGSRIPSGMTQVTTDYLAYGRPLDEAIGAPRFHPVTRRAGDTVSRFETERETDYRLAENLRTRLGWEDGTEAETEAFGGFTAIEVMPDGRLRGYADQRRTNTAMGY